MIGFGSETNQLRQPSVNSNRLHANIAFSTGQALFPEKVKPGIRNRRCALLQPHMDRWRRARAIFAKRRL